MIPCDRRMCLFVGNYGSGKTECSLHQALAWAQLGPTLLVDMDIINPYFRSAERAAMLQERGVRVICPPLSGSTVDSPAISAEVSSAFEPESGRVVMDVGGDDAGAVVLGRFQKELEREKPDIFFVINARRPLTNTADQVTHMLNRIQSRMRMPVTALINNTNMADQTTLDDIVEGQAITEAVSQRLNIPQRALCVPESLVQALPQAWMPLVVPMNRHMALDWQ